MGNIFAELQMQSANSMNTILDARMKMNEMLRIFLSQPERESDVKTFALKFRNLEFETLWDCDSFYIDEVDPTLYIPEDYKTDTYGMYGSYGCKFSGRYVYPVKDVDGNVMGWCGYDKDSDIKYLDSINYGYKAKNASVWGMEKMREYYTSGRQVFFTEGIVCALYARQCGEQALATLGSNLTPYVATIINRFGDKARIITDSDEAGNKFKRIAHRLCPKARVLQSKVAKDLDDSRKVKDDIKFELPKFEDRFYRSQYFT